MSATHRQGFTLIEVIVAMVVTATLALLAHGLFSDAADGGHRLALARRRLDRQGNARDFLRDAFLALDVGADSAGPFEGEPHRVRYTTGLPVPAGCNVRRTVLLDAGGGQFTAELGGDSAQRIVLADSVRAVGLDYLLQLGAGEHWVRDWHSAVSAPLAVRVRVTRAGGVSDTSLYLVKPRG
jgi:prepilin-type N-terminal cleavage/methylation domain-containing protein